MARGGTGPKMDRDHPPQHPQRFAQQLMFVLSVHALAWGALGVIATRSRLAFFRFTHSHGFFGSDAGLTLLDLDQIIYFVLAGIVVGGAQAAAARKFDLSPVRPLLRFSGLVVLILAACYLGLQLGAPGYLNMVMQGAYLGAFLAVVLVYAGLVYLLLFRNQWLRSTRSRLLRVLVWVLPAGVLAASVTLVLAPRIGSRNRPNVLMVSIDALRAGNLNCYGYSQRTTSESIDRLAAEGVLFTRAISQGPATKISVASLFSGLYASNHGVFEGARRVSRQAPVTDVLNPEVTTLAEVMQEAGWATFGAICGVHPVPQGGYAQGFDAYLYQHTSNDNLVDLLSDYLEICNRPFFAYLHFFGTHWKYDLDILREYAVRSGEGSVPDLELMHRSVDEKFNAACARGEGINELPLTPSELANLRIGYDLILMYIDDQIGRLTRYLRRNGAYENTIIVLLSDHGEALGQHSQLWHSSTLYNELIHVPLIVKPVKGSRPGARVRTPVPIIDLMPSIIDLVGLRHPVLSAIDGRSLRPLMEGRDRALLPILSENLRFKSLIIGQEKLIYDFDQNRAEIYDLATDFAETRNLLQEPGQSGLAADSEATRERIEAFLDSIAANSIAACEAEPSEQTIERMRALGYLQ